MLTGSRSLGEHHTSALAHFIRWGIIETIHARDRNRDIVYLCGDATGADTLFIKNLFSENNVKIRQCTVGSPRIRPHEICENYSPSEFTLCAKFESPTERDDYMLRLADTVIAVRAGTSPGTTRNIQSARGQKKEVFLIDLP